MNSKMTNGHLKFLKENYEKYCNAWLDELLDMWEMSHEYGFWVGEEVGGVYCHEEGISLDMCDIIFCVENNVPKSKYYDFVEYIEKCHEYNFNTPNLQSYVKGCPTIPQESFDRLDALKANLEECIAETKKKF